MSTDLEALVRLQWKAIHRFIRSQCPGSNSVDSMTAGAFVDYLQANGGTTLAEAHGRARNYLFDLSRRFAGSHSEPSAPGPNLPQALALQQDFDKHWFLSLINRARRRLKSAVTGQESAVDYRVFQLFYFGDGGQGSLPPVEIAQVLGIPVEAIEKALSRTRAAYSVALTELVRSYTPEPGVALELRDLAQFIDRNRTGDMNLSTIHTILSQDSVGNTPNRPDP